MKFQLFGKPARAGRMVRRLERGRIEAVVARTARGYLLTGTVSGRPGRIEVFRAPVPAAFLLNNWQSWGPTESAAPSTRYTELEAIIRDYSPYLFSPLPRELLRGPVSDYFVACDGVISLSKGTILHGGIRGRASWQLKTSPHAVRRSRPG